MNKQNCEQNKPLSALGLVGHRRFLGVAVRGNTVLFSGGVSLLLL